MGPLIQYDLCPIRKVTLGRHGPGELRGMVKAESGVAVVSQETPKRLPARHQQRGRVTLWASEGWLCLHLGLRLLPQNLSR